MRNLRNSTMCLSMAATILMVLASNAPAGVIMLHTGANDPTTESPAWTLSSGTVGVGEAGSEPDGTAYWKTAGSATKRMCYEATLSDTAIGDSEGWTATVRMKLVAGEVRAQAELQIIDKKDIWDFWFCDGTATGSGAKAKGIYTRTYGSGGSGSDAKLSDIDPTAAYHTYQIVFNPVGSGDDDDIVIFYIDGVQVGGTMNRAGAVNNTSFQRIIWGDNSSTGIATESRWALARFETGRHVVPEPGTMLLVGVGGLWLGRRRR